MTITEENLQTAFAGESQANRKYLAFSRKAEKEGFPNIARMFKAISEAETVHALNHLNALGLVKSTAENIEAALTGEHYEVNEMYPPMVDAAKEEGHKLGQRSTHYALEVEKVHEKIYNKALEAAKAGKDLDETNFYVCPVCGDTFEGDPPDNCPVCNAKKELFIKF